jgi:trimeric autotransporter adhesin
VPYAEVALIDDTGHARFNRAMSGSYRRSLMLACMMLAVTSCSPAVSLDGTTPDPPVLELGFSPIKRFDFRWEAVADAEWYELLESPAPGEPFAPLRVDIEGESLALVMPLHLRHEASYVLRACNPVGCSESMPANVDSPLTEAIGYFKASNTDKGDEFGGDIALSGDGSTLAVGARFEDGGATGIDGDAADDSAQGAGAVYVFTIDSRNRWSQQAYIKASNAAREYYFGHSVALSHDGSTLAVGSSNAVSIPGEAVCAPGGWGPGQGVVYVFARDSMGRWSEQACVLASNAGFRDGFGRSVAVSGDGNTLAVSAPSESSSAGGIDGDQADDSLPSAGAVYVFTRDSSNRWSQQAYVKATTPGFFDGFGHRVVLSDDGHTLAVSAPREDGGATGIDGDHTDDSVPGAGAVYVFVRDAADQWSQHAYIKAARTSADDIFGIGLALSGDGRTLAAGSVHDDGSATGIDDETEATVDSGSVHVFVRDSQDRWSQQAYLEASNAGTHDDFGMGVALSHDGNVLAVGATREDSSAVGIGGDEADDSVDAAGAAYVFLRNARGQWSQRAYVKASNTSDADPHDRFGLDVALSSNGSTLAVSAPDEASKATGIGGDQADESANKAGAVYLY